MTRVHRTTARRLLDPHTLAAVLTLLELPDADKVQSLSITGTDVGVMLEAHLIERVNA